RVQLRIRLYGLLHIGKRRELRNVLCRFYGLRWILIFHLGDEQLQKGMIVDHQSRLCRLRRQCGAGCALSHPAHLHHLASISGSLVFEEACDFAAMISSSIGKRTRIVFRASKGFPAETRSCTRCSPARIAAFSNEAMSCGWTFSNTSRACPALAGSMSMICTMK